MVLRLLTKVLKPVVFPISARFFVYEPVQRGPGYGHRAVSVRKPRFRDQSRKGLLHSKIKLGISGFCSGHSGYASASARLQSGVNKIPLRRSLGSVRDLFQLIGNLRASIQAIFPAPLHYRHLQDLKHQALVQRRGYMIVQYLCRTRPRGTTLVVGPPEQLERSCASACSSRYSNRDGRIEDGLGGDLPGITNRGIVVTDGEKASHQLLGATTYLGATTGAPIEPPEYRGGLAISELPRLEQLPGSYARKCFALGC